jgi:hypothetical protein
MEYMTTIQQPNDPNPAIPDDEPAPPPIDDPLAPVGDPYPVTDPIPDEPPTPGPPEPIPVFPPDVQYKV